jgi:hypothetical protein
MNTWPRFLNRIRRISQPENGKTEHGPDKGPMLVCVCDLDRDRLNKGLTGLTRTINQTKNPRQGLVSILDLCAQPRGNAA